MTSGAATRSARTIGAAHPTHRGTASRRMRRPSAETTSRLKRGGPVNTPSSLQHEDRRRGGRVPVRLAVRRGLRRETFRDPAMTVEEHALLDDDHGSLDVAEDPGALLHLHPLVRHHAAHHLTVDDDRAGADAG